MDPRGESASSAPIAQQAATQGSRVDDRQPTPLGHLGLTVPDIDAAIEWYADVLGWGLIMGPLEVSTDDLRVTEQLRSVFDAPTVAFRQAHMLTGSAIAVELFQFATPFASEGRGKFEFWKPGISHICVVERSIQRLADRIQASGGRQRTRVVPIFPGEPYCFCYCEDPFGNVIEIATHPHNESFGGRASY